MLLFVLLCSIAMSVRGILASLQSDSSDLDISGLDKAQVLRALFDVAVPAGSSINHYNSSDTLSDAEVEDVLLRGRADYLKGRYMKITFNEEDDTIVVDQYNEMLKGNVAEDIIKKLREAKMETKEVAK